MSKEEQFSVTPSYSNDGFIELQCLVCGEFFLINWLEGLNIIGREMRICCPSCGEVERFD